MGCDRLIPDFGMEPTQFLSHDGPIPSQGSQEPNICQVNVHSGPRQSELKGDSGTVSFRIYTRIIYMVLLGKTGSSFLLQVPNPT